MRRRLPARVVRIGAHLLIVAMVAAPILPCGGQVPPPPVGAAPKTPELPPPPAAGPGTPTPPPAVAESPAPGAVPSSSEPSASPPEAGAPDLPRDPFWPVKYVPRREGKPGPLTAARPEGPVRPPPARAEPDWVAARQEIQLRGIIGGRDGRFLARVNASLVSAGDEVSVVYGGLLYRWKVRAISAKGISTEQLDARPAE